MIRVAVIGAGLIGKERLLAIRALEQSGHPVSLAGIFDVNTELAQKAAAEFGTVSFPSMQALYESSPDWIVVALPHDTAVGVAEAALKISAHVLMEKPMGRDLAEAKRLLTAGKDRLHIGFNYRFYEGIAKAMQDAKQGRFGDLISVDFLLGHGCYPGQEKTWKLNDERAGGGCLIDPGIHLLDLCLQLAPDGFEVAGGRSWKGFWKTGIEEDVSLVLSSGSFAVNLHVSIVHWRSVFRMAIDGTDAYGVVSGRNRSYGDQSYTFGPRWGWQNAPSQAASERIEIQTDGNNAFIRETQAILFPEDNPNGAWPCAATAAEAYAAMELLDRVRERLGLRRQYSS
jgi:predicted dehydrogenase